MNRVKYNISKSELTLKKRFEISLAALAPNKYFYNVSYSVMTSGEGLATDSTLDIKVLKY